MGGNHFSGIRKLSMRLNTMNKTSNSINPVAIARMLRNESSIVTHCKKGCASHRPVIIEPLVTHKFYFKVTHRLSAVVVMTAEMHILCEARAIRCTNFVSVAKWPLKSYSRVLSSNTVVDHYLSWAGQSTCMECNYACMCTLLTTDVCYTRDSLSTKIRSIHSNYETSLSICEILQYACSFILQTLLYCITNIAENSTCTLHVNEKCCDFIFEFAMVQNCSLLEETIGSTALLQCGLKKLLI